MALHATFRELPDTEGGGETRRHAGAAEAGWGQGRQDGHEQTERTGQAEANLLQRRVTSKAHVLGSFPLTHPEL